MRYTKQAFVNSENTLNERRIKAQDEHSQRFEEIRLKVPEIANMYMSLSKEKYRLVGIIGSGKPRCEVREEIEKIKKNNLQTQQTIRNMLADFGYQEDYLQYHYYCPICSDTGFHDGKMCSCYHKLLEKYTTQELNEQCSIELHDFSEFRIDFYPDNRSEAVNPRERMSSIHNYCRDYSNSFGEKSRSLLFFGATGLGKTFLSSCIAKQLLSDGRNVFFGSILKLFRKIEDEHFGRAQGDTTQIIINAELVILDDLGSEFQTVFTDAVLYEIINERINLGKPMVISTNLSMEELNKKYNERIVSRLTGCFIPLHFFGSDIRQEKRKMRI